MSGPRVKKLYFNQPDMSGGLNETSDILHGKSTELLGGNNIVYRRPINADTKSIVTQGALSSMPPLYSQIRRTSSFTSIGILETDRKGIASFENAMWPNENWYLGIGYGTASMAYVPRLTTGNEAAQMSLYASSAAYIILNYSKYVDAAVEPSITANTILRVDTKWTGHANFGTGAIRIQTISAPTVNFIDFPITAPTSDGNFTLSIPFSLLNSHGTPNLSQIIGAEISLTTNAGGPLVVAFDDLRMEYSSSALDATGGICLSAASYDPISDMKDIKCVVQFNDCIAYGSFNSTPGTGEDFNSFIKIKTLSKTNSVGSMGSTSLFTRCYFCEVPDTRDPVSFPNADTSKNLLVFSNGYGVFGFYAHETPGAQLVTIDPRPFKYVCTHRNMVFLAGDENYPDTIAMSNVDDYLTFDPLNEITLDTSPSSDITGMFSMDDYLAISRNNQIYNLFGSDPQSVNGDFILKKTKTRNGVIEQGAAIRVGPYLYFFDGSDIYRYDGNYMSSVREDAACDSVTAGKITNEFANVPSNSKKNVAFSYYEPCNMLVCHFPYSLSTKSSLTTAAESFTVTINLDNGAIGIMGKEKDFSSVLTQSVLFPGNPHGFSKSYYSFGMGVFQWDGDYCDSFPHEISFQHQFTHLGSPGLMKDFDRYLIHIRDFDSETQPSGVNLDFYCNGDTSAPYYSVTGANPKNGVIDVLLNGCMGDSVSCKVSMAVTNLIDDAVQVGGIAIVYTKAEAL